MHGMRIHLPGIPLSGVLLLVLQLAHLAPIARAELLMDIETQPEEQDSIVSYPYQMESIGNRAIFLAKSAFHGNELWVTDGTALGTHEVKELVPGPDGVFFFDYAYSCDGLFMVPTFGSQIGYPGTGYELLVSDGTAEGTHQLGDLSPDEGSTLLWSRPTDFAGSCYMALYLDSDADGDYAVELWKTDGSPAGTQAVDVLKPAPDNLYIPFAQDMIVHDGRLFFTIEQELWQSDGTAAGTARVATIGTTNGIAQLVPMGGTLYFTADDDTSGRELWKSDGTTAGTVRVADIFPGSDSSFPIFLTAHEDALYFIAADTTNNNELWVSDGTSAGTHVVEEIGAGPVSGGAFGPVYSTGSGLLFIRTTDSSVDELWRSDGTAAGTELIEVLAANPVEVGSTRMMNGELYLLYENPDTDTGELFKYDSASEQVVSIAETGFPDETYMVVLESTDRLVFAAEHPDSGFEPWVSDGTTAGTHLLLNIYGETTDSWVEDFVALPNGTVIFPADNQAAGNELYTTTGSPESTALLADLVPGTGRSIHTLGEVYRDVLYYTGSGPADPYDFELWRTDGTLAGTEMVVNFNPTQDSAPGEYTLWNDILFFVADDDLHNEELWRLDDSGMPELVKEINPGTTGSRPEDLIASGAGLFFVVEAPEEGLWISDGTAAGTQALVSESDGILGVYDPVAFGSGVLFSAETAAEGTELWFSDGTTAGTAIVDDLLPGADSGDPEDIVSLGNVAVFTSFMPNSGPELWVTAGTAGTTYRLKDIGPGPDAFLINEDSVLGNELFFMAETPDAGSELWVTDGTSEGTRLFADLVPGAQGSDPRLEAASGGRVFFSANDGVHGFEVWSTDGTLAGTGMIADVEPGAESSSPRTFRVIDRRLYFVANTSAHGLEPHVLDVNRAPEPVDLDLETDENSALQDSLQASDADGDVVTYALEQQPENGTVELSDTATGEFTYTPDADFNGIDSFTFTASDDRAESAPGTVVVTANNLNVAPVADALSVSGDENTVISGTLAASDADGDNLVFAKAGDPANGTVTVEADGGFSYMPDADYTGADSFTFTASDGAAASAPATVSITVNGVTGDDGDDGDSGDGDGDGNNPPVDPPSSGGGGGGGSTGLLLLGGLLGMGLQRRRLS